MKNRIALARSLRRKLSLPEAMLWQALKLRPGGYKIRRQHPLGAYVLDFYCAAAKLAIEVDGISHEMGDRPGRDEARDDWLRTQGLEVLRISVADVLADVQGTVEIIVEACRRGQAGPGA